MGILTNSLLLRSWLKILQDTEDKCSFFCSPHHIKEKVKVETENSPLLVTVRSSLHLPDLLWNLGVINNRGHNHFLSNWKTFSNQKSPGQNTFQGTGFSAEIQTEGVHPGPTAGSPYINMNAGHLQIENTLFSKHLPHWELFGF